MEPKIYAGCSIPVDEHGCLVRFWDWTFEIAECLALESGIKLTPDHWRIVNWVREDFVCRGKRATLDEVLAHLHIDRSFLLTLFPDAPDATIARIAGIPRSKIER